MEKKSLKVLSYNIHKGFTVNNRRFVLSKIRDAIRTVHPDIVFLQEVLGEHETHSRRYQNWPDQPQFEYLAHELWPHFTYGKNAVYSAGHHGNAILSKFPFIFSENIDVSTNRLEKRGILHGVMTFPGHPKPLHAICVHLGLLEAERRQQIQLLCNRINSHVAHSHPLLVCGDFNDWRNRASGLIGTQLTVDEAFLKLHGAHARSFPSWMPALRLDRIYYRGMHAKKARCLNGKPWNELSDHTALYVELFFSSQAAPREPDA